MKRVTPIPVLVAVAVLALCLGSIGTAVAAPAVTKSTVKKLAAKVVKKRAPHLSVAHARTATTATHATTATTATTAGNATALGGLAATSFQNNVTLYTSSVTVPATANTWTIPLTPGDYHLSYSIFFPEAAAHADCYFYRSRGGDGMFFGEDTANTSYGAAMSGTGVVDIIAGDTVVFRCLRSVATTTPSDEPIQIFVSRIDALTAGGTITPTAKPGAARGN